MTKSKSQTPFKPLNQIIKSINAVETQTNYYNSKELDVAYSDLIQAFFAFSEKYRKAHYTNHSKGIKL